MMVLCSWEKVKSKITKKGEIIHWSLTGDRISDEVVIMLKQESLDKLIKELENTIKELKREE